MMASIGDIELGMIERLRAAGNGDAGVLGYSFEGLETYPDDWQAYWDNTSAQLRKYPAAWVTFAGASNVAEGSDVPSLRGTFGLIVGAKSLRNQVAARLGAKGSQVGSMQLAQDAARLLHGHRLGLDMGALSLIDMQFVSLTERQRQLGLSLIALRFSTRFDIDPTYFEPEAEFIGEFNQLITSWDIPPIINQTTTLNEEAS